MRLPVFGLVAGLTVLLPVGPAFAKGIGSADCAFSAPQATADIFPNDEIRFYRYNLGQPCAALQVSGTYEVHTREARDTVSRADGTGEIVDAWTCDEDPWVFQPGRVPSCDPISQTVTQPFLTSDLASLGDLQGALGGTGYPAGVEPLSDDARHALRDIVRAAGASVPPDTHPVATVDGWPRLDPNAQGEAVNSAVYLLQAADPGWSRPPTYVGRGVLIAAVQQEVRAFQQAQGLPVDGVVGPDTWQALIVTVQAGDQGAAVMGVQSQLRARGISGPIDGQFTAQLDAQVRDYQQKRGLVVDGIVGPQTWQSLLTGA